MSDTPLTDCPKCGQPALKKLVSAAGFRLKGAGWYETDFKSSGQRNLADGSGKNAKSATESNKKTTDKGISKGSGKSKDKGKGTAA